MKRDSVEIHRSDSGAYVIQRYIAGVKSQEYRCLDPRIPKRSIAWSEHVAAIMSQPKYVPPVETKDHEQAYLMAFFMETMIGKAGYQGSVQIIPEGMSGEQFVRYLKREGSYV